MIGSVSRREFLSLLGTSITATLLPGIIASGQQLRSRKPNIVFIMADDLGYRDLGCYGQSRIRTPNIDRLAAEGTRFTQVYAGGSVCAPSRSVLMTGQHTGHTTVRGNTGDAGGVLVLDNGSPQRRIPLREADTTVAEILKDAGYITGITGKWGLGEPNTDGTPNRQGFDEWFGYLNQRRAHSYYPMYLWRNDMRVFLNGNRGGERNQYTHDLFTEYALEFIRKHRADPFFLYIPYTVPHARYEIPELEGYENEQWSADAKVHAAMITRMDRDIGRIMKLIREYELDEDTIVFFCSDNGAARLWEGTFDSSGNLRGHKRDLYEGGIRTPMIIRYQGKVPEGQVNQQPWYFADVLPTLAELSGATPPDDIDGVSVLDSILGKQQEFSDRFMYWEHYGGGFNQAARWNDWKAVKLAGQDQIELYNLADDPSEENNVATQHPDILQMFKKYLQEAHIDSPHWHIRKNG